VEPTRSPFPRNKHGNNQIFFDNDAFQIVYFHLNGVIDNLDKKGKCGCTHLLGCKLLLGFSTVFDILKDNSCSDWN
jgi:hypothetical protein